MATETTRKEPLSQASPFVSITSFILFVGVVVTAVNIYHLQKILQDNANLVQKNAPTLGKERSRKTEDERSKRNVWVHGKQVESGYLDHVFAVFRRLGYTVHTEEPSTGWDVLWTHEYPFTELASKMTNIQPFQKVNHFPGCGFITNKVSLSTSKLKQIPRAFKLPADKDKFLEYATSHPEKMWVQKSNSHRGIKVEKTGNFNLDSEGTFIQEFVHNPLLIDGRKFDIGIYTILTSIDPLIVYIYDGDALFRFCEEAYHPFNETNVNSYVVGDDYQPIWKMPSLEKYYNFQSLSMKESVNAYLQAQGKDPQKIWTQIKEAIANVYQDKEDLLIQAAKKFTSTGNFFEMVRFDFVVDEDLDVYLLEANMSPNLSSAHFRQNQLLYEQVVYNLLSLVGLAMPSNIWMYPRYSSEFQMEVSDRDILVLGEACLSEICSTCQELMVCRLCNHCITSKQKDILKSAFTQHTNRRACRRVVPKSLPQASAREYVQSERLLQSSNDMLKLWFAQKCLQDVAWCA